MKRWLLMAAVSLVACDRPTAPPSLDPQSPADATALAPDSCPAVGEWTIQQLAPPGAVSSRAVAMNDQGQVVVVSDQGAFVWSEADAFEPIPVDEPQAVNNSGVVAGWNGSGLTRQAVVWSESSGLQLLAAPSGYGGTFAMDINDAGIVAGGAWGPTPPTAPGGEVPDETWAPVIWVSGVPQLLPLGDVNFFETLDGAAGINDGADVIGNAQSESFVFVIYWSNVLGGSPPQSFIPPGGDGGEASDINGPGQITGTRFEFIEHDTYLWSPSDSVTILTPGPDNSRGHALNDQAVVVGVVSRHLGGFEWGPDLPFRWTAGSGVEELPLLPGTTSGQALDINEAGNIVGQIGDQAVMWARDESPIAAIEAIADLVEKLGDDGALGRAQVVALKVSLEAAARLLADDKKAAARQILGAFAHKVDALIRSGRLAQSEGRPLRNAALCLMQRL